MKRVRRKLSRTDVESLRDTLLAQVPQATLPIPEILRTMRLIVRKSQSEYAKLCGVAPRVLADIEAGRGHPRVDTLEKLLHPFGYTIGVVALGVDEQPRGPNMKHDATPKAEKPSE
jgi:transcriptional regulator with XRE-family HTH domain